MSTKDDLRQALAFLTPLVRADGVPNAESLRAFPVAGMGIGALEGLIWLVARRRWPALPAAVAVVGADVVLTGALHLDGLGDSADGLFAHVPSKDRLDIMATPDIGVFGAVAVVLSLLGRAGALSTLEPSPVLLAALACGSRSVMSLAVGSMPYARHEGLASAFSSEERRLPARRAGVAGLCAALVLGVVAQRGRGARAVVCGALAAAATLLAARSRLGGYTGDVLGAAGSSFEVVGLMAAARR